MITELGKISIGLNKEETANVYGREIVYEKAWKDVNAEGEYCQAIEKLPINSQWKTSLIEKALEPNLNLIYKFKNVTAIIARLNKNESRAIYVTPCGHVLDHKESLDSLSQLGLIKLCNREFIRKCHEENLIHQQKGLSIWSFYANNYTHYLLDEWVHLALLPKLNISGSQIKLHDFDQSWKKEFDDLAGINTQKVTLRPNALSVISFSELIVPVNQGISSKAKMLSGIIDSKQLKNYKTKKDRDIIIIDSLKNGISRIHNLDEIISCAKIYGNATLVDLQKMSIIEKLNFFRDKANCIVICTGSSLTNCVIFKHLIYKAILLVEPWSIKDNAALYGGWAYYIDLYSKSYFVSGCEATKIPNSHMSSTIFNLNQISSILKNN